MVTIYFDPGPAKLQVVKAIWKTLSINLGDARDAVDLGRLKCDKNRREEVTKAIEKAGGKLV